MVMEGVLEKRLHGIVSVDEMQFALCLKKEQLMLCLS